MPKKLKKTGKYFVFFCLTISFALCVSLASLFASALSVGVVIYTANSMTTACDFYAISLASGSVSATLEEVVNISQKQGGAGFLWKSNGIFYVLASAYLNRTDAEKVKTNLGTSGTTATIFEIKIEPIDIQMEIDLNSKNILNSSLSSFKTVYETLYDIAISLDTNIKNETDCRVKIEDVTSALKKIKTNFESVFSTSYTSSILNIKLSLDEALESLDDLADFSFGEKQTFSSKIKYSYFEIIKNYAGLADNLNYVVK